MKIIINESQLRLIVEGKKVQAYLDYIKEYGVFTFMDTFPHYNSDFVKLYNDIGGNFPIEGWSEYDEETQEFIASFAPKNNGFFSWMFFRELVHPDLTYKNCEISYSSMSGTIEWECNWSDYIKPINTICYATPYYSNKSETVVNTEFIFTDDYEMDILTRDRHFGYFYSPEVFVNFNQLKDWFYNEYLPKTYEEIKDQYISLKPRFLDERYDSL